MRIVALDLIRFFAALSVVLYHYMARPESDAFPVSSQVMQYGYLGVPLFFIVSGYVIALSANNRTAWQFGVSRFVRLYPALWVGVLFSVLTLTVFTESRFSLPQVLANFTLLNDYLGFSDVDGVYWTLKAELKFYACIFLLLAFGLFQKHHYWLSAWLVLTALHTAIGQPFFMGWFISPEYSSFFIAGVACFLMQSAGVTPFNLGVFLTALVISSFRAFEQAPLFMEKNPGTLEQTISMVIVWLFFGFFFLLSTGRINLRESKTILTLGALTYPLYLIHNLAGKAVIDRYTGAFSERTMVLIVLGLMLVIAYLIHVGVEKPLASPLKEFLLAKLSRLGLVPKKNS